MKRKILFWVAAIVVVVIIFMIFSPDFKTIRTLASVRKVSDYPFYVMHYYGDYGFQTFLEEGIYPTRLLPQTSLPALESFTCTCFAALNESGEKYFGRNFDWYEHPILLLYTDPPDGYASVSMVDISYFDFDRSGIELFERSALLDTPFWPFDGMNEHGLAVGMMAVPYASGIKEPEKVTITELQVIRLLLDYARDVEEAIELLSQYNVYMEGPPIHYLIADASGKSVVVEYLGGDIYVIPNEEPWQVATNFIVTNVEPGSERRQCRRYALADEALEAVQGRMTVPSALELLETVSQPNTLWSNVYNLSTGEITVAIGGEYGEIYEFSLGRKPSD